MVKSRKMRWAGYVAVMGGEEKCIQRFGGGNLGQRDNLRNPSVDRMIILRWIFRNWDVGIGTGSSWLRIGTDKGTCDCGNESSGSIKCGEFLD